MTAVRERLQLAQAERRARADSSTEDVIDAVLDRIGLSEQRCIELALDPQEREKLKGIIARLRRLPHPFTQCMRDLRKHKPEWSEDRRKRTCADLKQAAGRGSGGNSNMALTDDGPCSLLTDEMVTLLEHADRGELEDMLAEAEIIAAEGADAFATLTYKQRKNLPKSSFVFPDKAPGPGSYPIQDHAHRVNALARASGKPEYSTVKAEVCKREPGLPACQKGSKS